MSRHDSRLNGSGEKGLGAQPAGLRLRKPRLPAELPIIGETVARSRRAIEAPTVIIIPMVIIAKLATIPNTALMIHMGASIDSIFENHTPIGFFCQDTVDSRIGKPLQHRAEAEKNRLLHSTSFCGSVSGSSNPWLIPIFAFIIKVCSVEFD